MDDLLRIINSSDMMEEISDRRKKAIIAIVITNASILLILALVFIFRPKSYTLLVKNIGWERTISIQKLTPTHHSGWSSPPSNAYNIETSQRPHGDTEIGRDSNGKPITIPNYDTWYEYTIDEWITSRFVVTQEYDRSPYWGEVKLATSTDPRNIGAEREGSRQTVYSVIGQLRNSDDTTLKTIEVGESLWYDVKIGDEINYTQRIVGKPHDISIAQ